MRAVFRRIAVLGCMGLAGCGVAAEGELEEMNEAEIGALEQALDSSCGTAAAQATFTGNMSTLQVSAAQQTSGQCGKAFMFDINNYNNTQYLSPHVNPASIPTNQADCEATDVRYYVWEKVGVQRVIIGSAIENGVWEDDGFIVGCIIGLNSPATLQQGKNYRFGVSVRRPSTTVRALTVTHTPRPQ